MKTIPDPKEPAPWYRLGPDGPEPMCFPVNLAKGAFQQPPIPVALAQTLPPHVLWWRVPSNLSWLGRHRLDDAITEEVTAMRRGWRLLPGGGIELTHKAQAAKERIDEYFQILNANSELYREFVDPVEDAENLVREMGPFFIRSILQAEGGCPLMASISLNDLMLRRGVKIVGDLEKALTLHVTEDDKI